MIKLLFISDSPVYEMMSSVFKLGGSLRIVTDLIMMCLFSCDFTELTLLYIHVHI